MVLVESLRLLGEGTQKRVYEHPDDNNKIIKIMGGVLKSMLVLDVAIIDIKEY